MLCGVLQWALRVILYSSGLRADSTVSLFFWTFFAILTRFLATRTDHFHAVVQSTVLQQCTIWWAKIFKFCPCPVHPESWRRMQMDRLITGKKILREKQTFCYMPYKRAGHLFQVFFRTGMEMKI
jgi:hypothetical protein